MTTTDHRPTQADTDAAYLALLDTLIAARRAQAWVTTRAQHIADGDWRNRDTLDRMATVAANTNVRFVAPGHIIAATPATHDGGIWHYLARDALTHAVPDATITMTDDHTWTAQWETTCPDPS